LSFFFFLQWAERCLAKELLNPKGGPSVDYQIALAKVKLAKEDMNEAEKHCCDALDIDYEVSQFFLSWKFVYEFGIFV
jgi:regulator of RNase E activity RraB